MTVLILPKYSLAETTPVEEKKKNELTADPEKSETKAEAESTTFFSFNLHANSQMAQQNLDTTNINSLSKFNFIFYFIYKLKYNDDPISGEYLESSF